MKKPVETSEQNLSEAEGSRNVRRKIVKVIRTSDDRQVPEQEKPPGDKPADEPVLQRSFRRYRTFRPTTIWTLLHNRRR